MVGLAVVLATATGCKKAGRTSAEVAEGQELFGAACARCHGSEGGGGLPLWDGGPSPPSFRNHPFHAARSDAQIRQTIVQGKATGMPPFGTTFNDTQLAKIVGHVRSLDPEAHK